MAKGIKGIRPSGSGTRITIYKGGKGKAVYDKTHPLDYYAAADLKQAIKIRDRLLSKIALGIPLEGEASNHKSQFFDIAQDYLDSRLIEANSRSAYKTALNKHCIPTLGNRVAGEITRKDIDDLVARWQLKVTSKRTVLSILSAVFKYAGISQNPCTGVSVGKERAAKKDRYRPDERDAIVQALSGHAQSFFAIFFGCGLRPGEIVALEWADYNGEHLYVNKQFTKGKFKAYTKTKEDRRVYVPTWVRPHINQLDTRLAGERLFLTNWYDDYYDEWREAHKTARVGAHRIRYRRPYTCRHTRAAELLSNGVLPAQAAKEMGHSPAMFLVTYAEFIEEYCSDSDNSKLEGTNPQKTRMKSASI